MKKLQDTVLTSLQHKVEHFKSTVADHLDPTQGREVVTKKINEFKSSDEENKFVTISSVMNLVSALIQITVGMTMKSMSVISSAVDSLLDFVLGMFNLFLLTQSKRKRDTSYNYGYGKLQWFGALSQGFVMMFFGIVLAYFSVLKLMDSAPVKGVGILIIVMILDFIGGVCCVVYYFLRVKKSENMIVIGTLKKLYAGLLFNAGIMSGLLLIYIWLTYFDAEWYFIDALVGLVVAGYICINAGKLLYDGYGMLMDRSIAPEQTKHIKQLIDSYAEDMYHWDGLRTRSSGTTKFIDFTVYFDAKKYSFTEIYKICLFLKQHLEDEIENSVVTIVPRPLDK